MKVFVLLVVCALCLFTIPEVTIADGLVPCTGNPGDECQFCHVGQLIDNVYDWVISVATILLVLIFVVAGGYLATSMGSTGAQSYVRKLITSAIIGYTILLSVWLCMGFFMTILLGGESIRGWGPWYEIECVDQPLARIVHPTPGESRGTAASTPEIVMPDGTIDTAAVSALAASGAPDDLVAAAVAAEGLDAEQARNLQALMRVESRGCQALRSPVGALGCLQIMPGTAKQYDPGLAGLSPSEVEERLLNTDYNIRLGARIYADLYRRYRGDTTKLYAGYNGGPGANNPSVNCKDKMRWQCEWDGSDCRDGIGSDCRPNTGYRETRAYVGKVNAVSAALAGEL